MRATTEHGSGRCSARSLPHRPCWSGPTDMLGGSATAVTVASTTHSRRGLERAKKFAGGRASERGLEMRRHVRELALEDPDRALALFVEALGAAHACGVLELAVHVVLGEVGRVRTARDLRERGLP